MPRKVKQKQRQRQTQKQTVIVKLEQPKKIKRERRKRVKKDLQEGEDDYQKYNPYFRQLPPPTIIQSFPQVPAQAPVQVPLFNPPQQMQFINAPPRQIPFLEDIGLVGTSEILDQPTKEEQLTEMITPVEKRTKKEIKEARQMRKEDIASINLGLSQFKPPFEERRIEQMNPSISSFEPVPEPSPALEEEPQTPKEKRSYRKKKFTPRRNSLEDLKMRYEKLQGEEPPNMKIGELKRQVQQLEKKFGYI